jgi:hypothetical protein
MSPAVDHHWPSSLDGLAKGRTSRDAPSVVYDSTWGVQPASLGVDGASWTWSGGSTGRTAAFSPAGCAQTAHHVRLDGDQWVPSVEVVLRKVI